MSFARTSPSIAAVSVALVYASVALAQEPVVVAAQKATAVAGQERKPDTVITPKMLPGATYGFSVVLLLGDMQGGATADNVPAAARRALADMKDFLPYKSYRLLDSAWVLGSGNVSTRLRGPEDQEYSLNVSGGSSREDPKTLHLSFQLREASQSDEISASKYAAAGEPASAARARLLRELLTERGKIEQQIQAVQERLGPNHPDLLKMKARLADLNREIAETDAKPGALTKRPATCCIISTGFTMEIGETVVVGTSRLRGGDKALIALLTAVARTR